ncbi:MAG: lamin tail domain-containing protein [Myxococcota bacterium]
MSLTRRSLLCCLFVFALAVSACGNDTGSGNNDNNGGQDADAQVDAGDDVAEDAQEDTVEDAQEDTTEDTSDDTADDAGDVEDDAGDAEDDAGDVEDDADATGPECGDGVIEGDEICDGDALDGQTCSDEGFAGGDLACNDACDGYVTTACTNCGNDTLDSGEACDGTALDGETCDSQGFDGGTLTCADDCTFDTSQCTTDTCGNGQIDSGEDCDGSDLDGETCSSQGFFDGTLACNNCQFDTSSCTMCGNDTVDSGETCDGTDLNGETCESLGYDGGTLACGSSCGAYDESGCVDNPAPGTAEIIITEIMQNPDAISDADGEYFELLNPSGSTTYNLNGCQITGSSSEPAIDITVDLEIAPGAFFTIARSASPGFTPDHVESDIQLSNSSDRLAIECPDGSGGTAVVDEVSWDDGDTFPDPTGASMNLTDEATATDAGENDNGYWWCATPTSDLGNGDLGTPGSANEVCPTATIDWCNLQSPQTTTVVENSTIDYYSRLYIAGVTDQDTTGNDPQPYIEAQVGYGPDGTDPQTNANWTWEDAQPNSGWAPTDDNDDEYGATITAPSPATYDTAFRYTGNYGQTWSYCDTVDNTYDISEAGSLTTTPATTNANAYFTEYIEGSGNNKALEVYNASTTTPLSLDQCVIKRYSNGSTSATDITFDTGASVAAEGTYSICNSSTDATYTGSCDELDGGVSFNGNDAVALVCNGVTLDVIGRIGEDPGSAWTGGGISTENQTLRRKCSVGTGDTDGTDPFDPSVEWNGFPQDDFSDLGDYTCP